MNSFKSFVKNIADKAGSDFSPVRSGSGGGDEDEEGGGDGTPEEQEGFICPSCMKGFATPEKLQVHYESEHGAEASLTSAKRSEGQFVDLKGEVSQMASVLREEQKYSTELKREVEKLSEAVRSKNGAAGAASPEQQERDMYREQVAMLEEGKRMLTNEVTQLRQKVSDSQLTAKEKEKLLEKAAQLSAENVSLKAAADEMSAIKLSLEERVRVLEEEAKQGSSSDDAALLKQELVSVQKLMDEMTVEKDKQLSELRDKHEALIAQLGQSEGEKGVRLQELTRARDEELEKRKDLEKKFNESQMNLAKSAEETATLRKRLSEVESAMLGVNSDASAREDHFRRELDTATSKCEGLEGRLADALSELSALQSQYDDRGRENDEVRAQLIESRQAAEEETRAAAKAAQKLQEAEGELEGARAEVRRMGEERQELMTKIEAGEGASAALDQLKEQNESLTEKLSQSTAQHKSALDELRKNMDNITSEMAETKAQLQREADKASKFEKLCSDKDAKITSLEQAKEKTQTALDAKTEQLNEAEASRASTKRDLESQLASKQSEMKSLMESTLALQTKNEEAVKQRDNLDNQLKELQKLNKQLQTESSEMGKRLEESLQESKRKDATISKYAAEAKSSSEAIEKAQSEAQRSAVMLQESQSKVSSLAEEVGSLREQQCELMSTVEDQVATLAAVKKEARETLERKGAEMKEAEERKDGQIKQLESDLEELKNHLEEAKVAMQQLQSAWDSDKERQDERIGDLEKAKEVLLEAKVTLQGNVENLESQLEAKDEERKQQEEEFQKQLDKANQETERRKKILVEQATKHEEALTRHRNDADALRKTAEELRALLSAAEGESAKVRSELAEAGRERDAALGDKLELEAKIAAAGDERRTLLERCLEAEAELERSRSSQVELQRKLDDLQAALHELGRENQSIQVELAKESGRKWADDAEVNSCAACSCSFSLTNRKHHCRNCGQIFCADCSSRQAAMPNYRRPQRACDACYAELVRNGSAAAAGAK